MKSNLLFILIVPLLLSCNKFLDIEAPTTQVETDKVFTDANTATSAVAGLYAQMINSSNNFFSGAMSTYTGLSSDELTNPGNSSTYAPYLSNELLATTSSLATIWRAAYTYIYQVNTTLESLQKSTQLSQEVKDTLRGEMLFTRSIMYFYLTGIWGDVPLIVSTDYKVNATLPRSPVDNVYKQIEADLLEAKVLLSTRFRTPNKTRPDKWAATALLARLYLYQKRWQEADDQSTEIINSHLFVLEPTLNNVFITSSRETIWQISKANANTAEGGLFVPTSATSLPTFCATDYLLSAFEANDARKSNWLKVNTVSGRQYFHPFKYKIRSSTTITEYYVVLRLAEQYLIKAEALAMLNNLAGAQTTLNAVRTRAGITSLSLTNADDLLAALQKERQTELFAEWGHRWFDLKRTGKADEVLGVRKAPNWQANDVRYPIPNSQIESNPALVQNPGYSN